MINAWSLAWEALYGDMDKEYPIKNESYDDFENPLPPQDVDMSIGAGNTALDNDGLDGVLSKESHHSFCLSTSSRELFVLS